MNRCSRRRITGSLAVAAIAVAPAIVSAQGRDTAPALRLDSASSAAGTHAQASSDTSSALDPVVVTATRLPTPLSSVTQAVTVLRGDELRARGVNTVALALREVPGAAVVQSGSYGGVTSLFLRGGESRYTKVLIDGVPVNTVGGTFFFENLTLDNVDRIEVVRGPESALYGADALSGVVQIFTKRGAGAPVFGASARAGTYGSREGSASVTGATSLASYSLGGGVHRTDGIYSFNNNYYNGTLSGGVVLTPDSRTNVNVFSRYTGAEYHFPTDYTGVPNDSNSYTLQHRLTTGIDASRALSPYLTLHVIGGDNEAHDLSEDLTRGGQGGMPVTTRQADSTISYLRSGEVRVVSALGALAKLTLGGEYQQEYQRLTTVVRTTSSGAGGSADTVTTAPATTRVTHGYYAAVQGGIASRAAYDASLRYDNHSDFKNVLTYHTGVNVAVAAGARVRASYGTGFNAPAFYETQGSAYNRPNPSLQPEQTHTLDAALEETVLRGHVRVSVGAFDQHFSQLIQYMPGTTSGPPNYTPVTPAYYDNLTAARSRGYEGELHAMLPAGVTADASYTQAIARVYSVPANYSGSETPGQELIRRPSHSGNVNVAYTRPGIGSTAVTASYIGKRLDQDFSTFPSATVTLPAYVRVDVGGSLDIMRGASRSVSLTGRIENALNRRYEDVFHFQTPGRAIFVGATVSAYRE